MKTKTYAKHYEYAGLHDRRSKMSMIPWRVRMHAPPTWHIHQIPEPPKYHNNFPHPNFNPHESSCATCQLGDRQTLPLKCKSAQSVVHNDAWRTSDVNPEQRHSSVWSTNISVWQLQNVACCACAVRGLADAHGLVTRDTILHVHRNHGCKIVAISCCYAVKA